MARLWPGARVGGDKRYFAERRRRYVADMGCTLRGNTHMYGAVQATAQWDCRQCGGQVWHGQCPSRCPAIHHCFHTTLQLVVDDGTAEVRSVFPPSPPLPSAPLLSPRLPLTCLPWLPILSLRSCCYPCTPRYRQPVRNPFFPMRSIHCRPATHAASCWSLYPRPRPGRGGEGGTNQCVHHAT